MVGITLEIATAKLTEWLAADSAVATGQTYSIAGRSLSRADAKTIRENITYWAALVRDAQALAQKQRRGIRIRGGTPV